MDSIINELYYDNIRPVEQMGGLTAEAAAIMKRVHKNENRLEACLDKQEKELFTPSRMTALKSPASSRKNDSAKPLSLGQD